MKKSYLRKTNDICECDAPGMQIDIYYEDEVCRRCGKIILSNFRSINKEINWTK